MSEPDFDAAARDYTAGPQTVSAPQVKLGIMAGQATAPNPDVEAQMRRAADIVGVPYDAARGDFQSVQKQAQFDGLGLDQLPAQAPRTAQYLADPGNAALAHDDVHNLSGVEQSANGLQPFKNSGPLSMIDFPAYAASNHNGPLNWAINQLGGLFGNKPGELQDQATGAAAVGTAKVYEGLDELNDAYDRWMANTFFGQHWQGDSQGTIRNRQALAPQIAQGQRLMSGGRDTLANKAFNIAGGVAPLALASAIDPFIGATAFGGQGASDVYDKAKAKGLPVSDAGMAANAVLQAGLGSFGAEGKVADLLPSTGSKLLDFLAKGVAKVGVGAATGGAMTVGENAIVQATEDPTQSLTEGAGENAATMAAMAAFFHTTESLASARYAAMHGQANAAVLDNLAQAAQASKLRVRAPDDFRAFVKDVAENGPVSDVYVNGNTFAQAMDTPEGRQALEAMPDVAAQLPEAQASGQDVRVPLEDFATHVAPLPNYAALADHLKTDPDGLTRSEAAEAVNPTMDQLRESFDQTLAEKNDDAAFRQSSDRVRDQIQQQLDTAQRFTSDVNSKYADLASQFFQVQASRLGVTPEEMYARYPLRITAGDGSVIGSELAHAPEMEQGGQGTAKGTFNPDNLTIALNKNADLSTFLHELGHFHLEALSDLAARPDTPDAIRGDMDTVLKWFNPDMTHDQWRGMSLDDQRQYHEQFARGFEQYLFEGKAPSTGLKALFQRFSSWLVNIYRQTAALHANLSDEVRGVMDRLLATRDQIADTEAMRALANPFTFRPDGMTPEEWTNLNHQAAEATLDAQSTLQTRSLRDMQWLEGAKSRELRKLQREAASKRKDIKTEVTAEVNAEPINQARHFLKHGEVDGEPVENAGKLDLETVKGMFPNIPEAEVSKALGTGKYGMLGADGLHPDVVADMFGFSSGEGLIHHLLSDEDPKAKIEGVTDQRMLERYGDLIDQDTISRAADEAVMNAARIKFMASGLAALDKSMGDRSTLLAATKALAAQAIGRQTIRDLRPDLYMAAEARAGRAVLKAMKAGDVKLAAEEMRKQLFNAQAAKAAYAARDAMAKGESLFNRIITAKDDNLGKSRNMDVVNAARAILEAYGFSRAKNSPAQYLDLVKEHDPILYGDLMPWVQAALDAAPTSGDVRDISVDSFNTLRDTVTQLYDMARRSQQMRREGQLVELRQIAEETLSDLPEGPGPYAGQGRTQAITKGEDLKTGLLGAVALLRRVEDWSINKGKNFHRNIFQPLSDASLRFRELSTKYRGELLENLKAIEHDLKSDKIEAPELAYTFGAGTGGGGLAELIGALRHTGNESNLEKLLVGRGWAEFARDGSLDTKRWDAFVKRMHDQGVLKKEHWDYVQSEWNLHEAIKPLVQEAHRNVYGRYFNEVEARPVETPFGEYKGGYVPAITDPRLVDETLMRQDEQALLGGGAGSFMFPSPAAGFTKARNANYAKALALDLRLAGTQVDAALKFATLAEPVRDALRLIKNKDLAGKLRQYDPTAATDVLLPWLQRTASQTTSTPTSGKGGRMIDGLSSIVRRRAVMAMMFGNLANTPLHVTGIFPAALRTGKGAMAEAVFKYMRNPFGMAKDVTEASPFMADRATNHMHEMADAVKDIVEQPNLIQKVENWSVKHTFFLQHAVWNVVDHVVWTAAYNKGVSSGERDPVAFADSVVRTTIGSHNAVDVSKFESGPAWAKTLTTFSGYFINQANTVGSEFAKAIAAKKVGRGLEVYMLGILAPAFLGELMTNGMRGQLSGSSEESPWEEVTKIFFGSQLGYLSGAVPFVGPMVRAVIDRAEGKSNDTSLTPSAISPVAAGALGAPQDVIELAQGKGSTSKTIRDSASLVTMLTGIPATLVARPAAYAAQVGEGKVTPTGPLDATRGLLTGSASSASRNH